MATVNLLTLIQKHPKIVQKYFHYGTSGFRHKADQLDSVAFRMGILSAIRSKNQDGQAMGLMVTASHNPQQDNGIKIIDPLGTMLDSSWESFADILANVDDQNLEETVQKLLAEHCQEQTKKGVVFIAYDTRPSSESLTTAAIDGVAAVGSEHKNFGLLTTPQLHWIVSNFNRKEIEGEASEVGYYRKMSAAFLELNKKSNGSVYLDCSNGVGALKMKALEEHINREQKTLDIKYFNAGEGLLNHQCGADYVKINQKFAENVPLDAGVRCISFDGDADRIVYYYLCPSTAKFILLDGDKIAVLIMSYLKELFTVNKIEEGLDFCVVQTAYANGSSTKYIEETLKVNTACVLTGVKHLEHRAQKSDVAVFFEANGHGTACFSGKVCRLVESLESDNDQNAQHLKSLLNLINQTNGDAMSDLLLIETILNNRNWTIEEWNRLYEDLPNRQLKIPVPDRNLIKTYDCDRRCSQPAGLQDQIDEVVASYGQMARCFVRPSGTEDIIRVYSEAGTQQLADELAEKVAELVAALVCK